MTFLWLIFWLVNSTPAVQIVSTWNSWGIALLACLALDLIGAMRSWGMSRR